MIFKTFIQSDANFTAITEPTRALYLSGMYQVLLDLAALKSVERTNIQNGETRAAWHDGYVEAVRDLFEFAERYRVKKELQATPDMDFGAIESLYNNKEITEHERELLRKARGSN